MRIYQRLNALAIYASVFLLWISPYAQTLPGNNMIHGFIRDKETGEPIPYGNVFLQNTTLGAATDVHGYYVIRGIPDGTYILVVSVLGFEQIEKEIIIQQKGQKRFDLEVAPQAIEGETVVVTAEKERFKEDVEISRIHIRPEEISKMPSFIESDVFRSVQQLPSVTSQNDFSSALIVRGGSPDENLILLDGAEIYNPYHLVGLFSTFNADAISDAEFMAGGYPAEYTGKLSSVLNITSREGNSRQGKFFNDARMGTYWDLSRLKADVSLLSSRALAEGPFYKGAWILSGRRTYFDLVADLVGEGSGWDYYFWDNQFKIFSDLNEQNRLTFSTYTGRDILNFMFDEEDFNTKFDFDWDWGNSASTLKWRYIPSTSLLSEFMLTRSTFDFDLNLDFTEIDSAGNRNEFNFDVINNIEDISATEKLTWFVNPEHTLTLGTSFKHLTMRFNFELDDITYFNIRHNPHVFSLFVQDKWKVNDRLSFQLGLRGSKYELHDRMYLDPRLGFKYLLTEDVSLKGNWGMFNQFLFTTNDENEILQIVDFWQPVPEQFDAIHNQHYILGLEKWFQQGFTGSVEGYYKPYSNVLTNNPNNDPAIENDEFLSGKGHSWGIELLLRKTAGKFTGWLGYSYTDIERRFDFNGDGRIRRTDNEMSEIYEPKYSKPHSLNLVTSFQLNEKHQLSISWTVASGQPYTPVVGKVFYGGYDMESPYSNMIDIQGRKNASRYPMYIRGDFSWSRTISLFGLKGKFNAQVINFTNHYNVLTYVWDHEQSPSQVRAVSMFPFFPSVGIEFEY